jgi:nucleotide-binding universal stress UspA family protein
MGQPQAQRRTRLDPVLRTILFVADASARSQRALAYGTELAQAAGAGLVVVRPGRPSHRVHLLGSSHPQRDRHPATALLAEIERRRPDLVVMATRRPRLLGRWLDGDVEEAAVVRGECPVLLVAPGRPTSAQLHGKRILLPLDGTAPSEAALPTATLLARTLESELVLLRAVEPVSARSYLRHVSELDAALSVVDSEEKARGHVERLARRLSLREDGLSVTSVVRIGALIPLLHELTSAHPPTITPAGLVVLADHPRRTLAGTRLGGVADAILRETDIPLVVVSPPI